LLEHTVFIFSPEDQHHHSQSCENLKSHIISPSLTETVNTLFELPFSSIHRDGDM
jgi:hypothetical protein